MADLTNAQIAAAFEELADLYELDGAVQYRVIAYRNAARTVRDSSVSVAQLARDGRVTELPGIGKTLEEKLIALDETGDIPAAVKLRARIPVGLVSVMHLPGFGPKRARRLYDEIGVDSLDALRAAVEDGRLRELRGFGVKAEENLKRVLAEHEEDGPARASCCGGRWTPPSRSSRRCGRIRRPSASRSPDRCAAGPTRSRTSTSSPPPPIRPRWPARWPSSRSSSRSTRRATPARASPRTRA